MFSDETEIAWAAGFFDGEGSTCALAGGRVLRVSVGQKDRRALDRFCDAVGYGNIRGPYKHGTRKDGTTCLIFHWACEGEKALGVIKTLWPYLGEAKREQIRTVQTKLVSSIDKDSQFHGTLTGYARCRCRCSPCRAEKARYERERRAVAA